MPFVKFTLRVLASGLIFFSLSSAFAAAPGSQKNQANQLKSKASDKTTQTEIGNQKKKLMLQEISLSELEATKTKSVSKTGKWQPVTFLQSTSDSHTSAKRKGERNEENQAVPDTKNTIAPGSSPASSAPKSPLEAITNKALGITSPTTANTIKNTSVNNTAAISSTANNKLSINLNGLDALTQKVIPVIASQAGLDHTTSYNVDLPTRTFRAYEISDIPAAIYEHRAVHIVNCYKLYLSLKFDVKVPVDEDSITAEFKSNMKMESTWHLPDASVAVTLYTDLDDLTSNASCVGYDIADLVFGSSHFASVSGLSGDVGVTLANNSHSQVSIDDVYKFDPHFGDMAVTHSDVLNWLLDAGAYIQNIFNTNTRCSTFEDCVGELLQDNVLTCDSDDTICIKDELLGVVNDSLKTSLDFQNAVSQDGLAMDFDVAESDLDTNGDNELQTNWNVTMDSDNPDDDCAANLTKNMRPSLPSTQTVPEVGGDIDIGIPFSHFDQLVYLAGKQGVFCADLSGRVTSSKSSGEVRHAGGSYEFSDPVTPSGASSIQTSSAYDYTGEFVPDGAIVVSSAYSEDSSKGATLYLSFPFQATIDLTASADVPEINTGNATADRMANHVDITTQNIISGTAKITTELSVDCEESLYLDPKSVELNDIEGNIDLGVTQIPATQITTKLQRDINKSLKDKSPGIALIPRSTTLTDLGSLNIEIYDVIASSGYLSVGLNITKHAQNYKCLDEEDESSSSGHIHTIENNHTPKIEPTVEPLPDKGIIDRI